MDPSNIILKRMLRLKSSAVIHNLEPPNEPYFRSLSTGVPKIECSVCEKILNFVFNLCRLIYVKN